MIVTELQSITKKKYRVVTDEQLAFVLYKSELSHYRIREGAPIEEQDLQKILHEVLPLRAKKYAMNLLTKRDRTEKELREKIRGAGYPEEIVEEAVNYVASFGYLDDERYARQYLEVYQNRQSFRQSAWKLAQKGVCQEIIARVVEQYEGETDQEAVIRKLVEKRVRDKKFLTDKELRNVVSYLGRRGFVGDLVWQILRSYREEETGSC